MERRGKGREEGRRRGGGEGRIERFFSLLILNMKGGNIRKMGTSEENLQYLSRHPFFRNHPNFYM